MEQQYGSVTEQGDLSLGWNPFTNESDQKAYAESITPKQDVNQQPINEEKKD